MGEGGRGGEREGKVERYYPPLKVKNGLYIYIFKRKIDLNMYIEGRI